MLAPALTHSHSDSMKDRAPTEQKFTTVFKQTRSQTEAALPPQCRTQAPGSTWAAFHFLTSGALEIKLKT